MLQYKNDAPWELHSNVLNLSHYFMVE